MNFVALAAVPAEVAQVTHTRTMGPLMFSTSASRAPTQSMSSVRKGMRPWRSPGAFIGSVRSPERIECGYLDRTPWGRSHAVPVEPGGRAPCP